MSSNFFGNQIKGSSEVTSLPQNQIPRCLDSVNCYLDDLESSVQLITTRLADVCMSQPVSENEDVPGTLLVPLASRISYIGSRVRALDQQLRIVINSLEI